MLRRRDARPEDAATVIGWFPARQEAVWWGGPTVPDPLTADWLVAQFALGTYWIWADANGAMQAVAGLQALEGGTVHLTRFGIAPAMRGKGMAAPLLREIMDFARQHDGTQMSLWVYGSNTVARRVYDRFGFRHVSQRSADEDASGVSIHMQCDL